MENDNEINISCGGIIINKVFQFAFFWLLGTLAVEIFKLDFEWDWRCALFCVLVHTLLKSLIKTIRGG